MDLNKLTQKSQEALQEAQSTVTRHGHTEVDGEHLLAALLDQPEGLAPRLLAGDVHEGRAIVVDADGSELLVSFQDAPEAETAA
jgi:ATP-dependent Clp protease ATP-binding subunit ClpB